MTSFDAKAEAALLRQTEIILANQRQAELQGEDPIPPMSPLGRFAKSSVQHVWQQFLPIVAVIAAGYAAITPNPVETKLPCFYIALLAAFLGTDPHYASTSLRFTTREFLYLPDRGALLAARHRRRTYVMLGRGLLWAIAVVMMLGASAPQTLEPTWLLIVGTASFLALLAPWSTLVAQQLKLLTAPGTYNTSVLLLLIAASSVQLSTLPWGRPGFIENLLVAISSTPMILLLGIAPVLLYLGWRRQPRRQLAALWPELLQTPHWPLILVFLAPISGLDKLLPWLLVAGVAAIVSLPFAAQKLLAAVRHSEAGVSVDDLPSEVQVLTPAATWQQTARPHAGRRPLRAAWLADCSVRGRKLALAFRLGMLLVFIFFACVPVAGLHSWSIVLGLVAPEPTHKLSSTILFRWGLDYTDQARLQVTSVILSSFVTFLLMVAMALLLGFHPEMPLRLGYFGAAVCCRLGWRGLLQKGEQEQITIWAPLGLLAALLSLPWMPLPAWWLVAAASSMGLLGLILRIRNWHEPTIRATTLMDAQA